MIIIDVAQGTDDWFAARLGRPTGSVYSDVLAKGKDGGKSLTRQKLIVKLALELVTKKPSAQGFKSQAMLDGTDREPFARALYESSRGVFVDEVGFCQHDTIFTGVSPDGLVGEDGLCEIKCPSEAVHREYMMRSTEPPEYKAQIQGQMWVTGRKWTDFVSYHPDFPENAQLIVRRVLRDDAYIANLESEVIKFNAEVEKEAEAIINYREAA
jgi:hypothetical protein